jgi:5-methylcytosine-specific restriction endonuclease McrA
MEVRFWGPWDLQKAIRLTATLKLGRAVDLLRKTLQRSRSRLNLAGSNDPYKKKPIPAWFRWAVFKRDGYKCCRCGGDEDLTVDHIHPESLGGQLTPENTETLCRSCNSSKNDKI